MSVDDRKAYIDTIWECDNTGMVHLLRILIAYVYMHPVSIRWYYYNSIDLDWIHISIVLGSLYGVGFYQDYLR